MALAAALAPLCPAPGRDWDNVSDGVPAVILSPRDGCPLQCHAGFLRARCALLPQDDVLEVPEDLVVLCALLRWVYSEAVDPELLADGCSLGSRVVRLGRLWGLRDVGALQSRVAARRLAERARGSLAADVLRAYEEGALEGRFAFEELPGGWPALLRGRASYFAAMLGGGWAESAAPGAGRATVAVGWPRWQLARLLRFLHGGEFVQGPEDLQVAVDCAKFFGVPSLFARVNDWISEHLEIANAPYLWNLVEGEAMLRHCCGGGHSDVADADDACLDFHIRNFEELVQEAEQQDREADAPLFQLSPALMQRVLASGLVEMPSTRLLSVVVRFAQAHAADKSACVYKELLESLRPPAVLFNREHRSSLLPVGDVTIRSFV